MWQNTKNMTNLWMWKNSEYDKTQKSKFDKTQKNQNVTEHKNSKCDKTKLILWQNPKTKKTLIFWQNYKKISKYYKTKKISKCDKTKKNKFNKTYY